MLQKRKILAINGSASKHSSNLRLLKIVQKLGQDSFDLTILDDLTNIPHFQTQLSLENTPEQVIRLRERIEKADGIIICTPEYVMSIPSGLKNLIEWCVSETVFSDKPTGLISASANGLKGHEELKLIMQTIQSRLTEDTTLLIQGIKSKLNSRGDIIDEKTKSALSHFVAAYIQLIEDSSDK